MFISVIVPVYNVEEYLDKCLESLLNQHYSDMEIVVVDDKSTDDSLNIAKKYEKYTNVKVIAKERNSGLSDTRNVGIKESCGQYIMFLDSDSFYFSTAIYYLGSVCYGLEFGKVETAS